MFICLFVGIGTDCLRIYYEYKLVLANLLFHLYFPGKSKKYKPGTPSHLCLQNMLAQGICINQEPSPIYVLKTC